MNVKTDTKEKFSVITPEAAELTANMTEDLNVMLLPYLQKDIPHIILKMSEVHELEDKAAEMLATLQQRFYENNASLVICELQPLIEAQLDKLELLELLNVTPTESEAWDIVQMELIEREILGGEE